MTKEQLNAILDRVSSWPASKQEDAVRLLLALEQQDEEPYVLSEEERADAEAGLAEMDAGKFASDEDVAALFNRFRR
jgi:predicted transcriptional regulator